MALHEVNKTNTPKDERQRQEDAPSIKACPVCEGAMEVVYDRYHQKVTVCTDCHTGITVPGSAWEVARLKREAKWMPKP
jgi:hypothetical protein